MAVVSWDLWQLHSGSKSWWCHVWDCLYTSISFICLSEKIRHAPVVYCSYAQINQLHYSTCFQKFHQRTSRTHGTCFLKTRKIHNKKRHAISPNPRHKSFVHVSHGWTVGCSTNVEMLHVYLANHACCCCSYKQPLLRLLQAALSALSFFIVFLQKFPLTWKCLMSYMMHLIHIYFRQKTVCQGVGRWGKLQLGVLWGWNVSFITYDPSVSEQTALLKWYFTILHFTNHWNSLKQVICGF